MKKKPEVGDLVATWSAREEVFGRNDYRVGIVKEIDKSKVPFFIRISSGQEKWFTYAQTITPDQVKDVINGVWEPIEEPKPGDLVVAWDGQDFNDATNRLICLYGGYDEQTATVYKHDVKFSPCRRGGSYRYVQKITPEEIPDIFKEGWKPRGY